MTAVSFRVHLRKTHLSLYCGCCQGSKVDDPFKLGILNALSDPLSKAQVHGSICHVTTKAIRQGHLLRPHTLYALPTLTN